jgi:hypothetical protein
LPVLCGEGAMAPGHHRRPARFWRPSDGSSAQNDQPRWIVLDLWQRWNRVATRPPCGANAPSRQGSLPALALINARIRSGLAQTAGRSLWSSSAS